MSRTPRLSERFLRSRFRLGLKAGSPEGADVARLLRQLAADETLPKPGDTRTLVPPTGEAFVRRVPARNLWVWYRLAADGELYVIHLSSGPPTPIVE